MGLIDYLSSKCKKILPIIAVGTLAASALGYCVYSTLKGSGTRSDTRPLKPVYESVEKREELDVPKSLEKKAGGYSKQTESEEIVEGTLEEKVGEVTLPKTEDIEKKKKVLEDFARGYLQGDTYLSESRKNRVVSEVKLFGAKYFTGEELEDRDLMQRLTKSMYALVEITSKVADGGELDRIKRDGEIQKRRMEEWIDLASQLSEGRITREEYELREEESKRRADEARGRIEREEIIDKSPDRRAAEAVLQEELAGRMVLEDQLEGRMSKEGYASMMRDIKEEIEGKTRWFEKKFGEGSAREIPFVDGLQYIPR